MSIHSYRAAVAEDGPLILEFIRSLADHQLRLDQVEATEESLRTWLFEKQKAQVLFALDESGQEVGFALYYHRFSTFSGRSSIYVEDLFVKPAQRRCGHGRGLLAKIAQIARGEGSDRLEWRSLKRNHQGIAFYTALGAETLEEWDIFQLGGGALVRLSEEA